MEILADVSRTDFVYELQVDATKYLLTLPDGWYAFRHVCDRGRRGTIICSPELTRGGHTVSSDGTSVAPSILCRDCGVHGYIVNGRWNPA